MDPRTLLGSVDIRETDKDYQFIVDVPGLTKEDVKVRVSGDNILTIEGERKVSAHLLDCPGEQLICSSTLLASLQASCSRDRLHV